MEPMCKILINCLSIEIDKNKINETNKEIENLGIIIAELMSILERQKIVRF